MLPTLLEAVSNKIEEACVGAENPTEMVQAIRSIPEHRRLVFTIQNSDSARKDLASFTKCWIKTGDREFDFLVASSIIAFADSNRDEEAISLSRAASCDPSLVMAAVVADSYLLQKALE